MAFDPAIFKAYDIRGIYPAQIDEQVITKIGQAYAKKFQPQRVVVGADVRLSSPSLKAALIAGLTQSGVSVIDIGTVSTDMMYFAVSHLQTDGGLTVSASHNPAEYNGLKIVLADAVPVSSDTGLLDLKALVVGDTYQTESKEEGKIESQNIMPEYINHLKKFADFSTFKPLKVVANGNYGMAATAAKELLSDTPIELILLNEEPDGHFPKGRPDPMWADNRTETVALIKQSGADLGVTWDADADRCFFFDENGDFINPYYITALLADILLSRQPGGKILTDPRLIWATESVAQQHGAELVLNKAGHTFIKERMRQEDILFGGESSAHYYFRDNHYADNGMIPFVMVIEALSQRGLKMSELMSKYLSLACCIDEYNFTAADGAQIVRELEEHYRTQGAVIDKTDGAAINFPTWRFSIRTSNTEPLVRLNLEAKTEELVARKFAEIKLFIAAQKRSTMPQASQPESHQAYR